jgi:DNA-binding IclR family transcriptional regulator
MPTNDPAQSSQVKSATRTLDIIEYVVARDRPLVAQEIAMALGIPVSSLSYLLGTLVERGYLIRQGRRYSAGPGLERLQARPGGFSLAERAAPLVRTLRVQLNETTSFFVRQGWEVEAIVTETSEQALRYAVPTGARLPMHALASGKALLAALPDDESRPLFCGNRAATFHPRHGYLGEGAAPRDRGNPQERFRADRRRVLARHPRRRARGHDRRRADRSAVGGGAQGALRRGGATPCDGHAREDGKPARHA